MDQMDHSLSHKIQQARHRFTNLQRQARAQPDSGSALLSQAMEELELGFEELFVAQEEISQQNEELLVRKLALEAERQRYQELFAGAPEAYLVTDTEGTIQEANRAASLLLNVSPQFLVGKPLIVYIDKADRQDFHVRLSQLLRGKELDQDSDSYWDVRLQPRHRSACDVEMTVRQGEGDGNERDTLSWLFHDVTAHKQVENTRQLLSQRVIEVQENERHRLAHSLHDEIGQLLALLKIHIQSLESESHNTAAGDVSPHMAQSVSLVDQLLYRVREMALDLRPTELDDFGLASALEEYATRHAEQAKLALDFTTQLSEQRLPQDIETVCFRVAQEALTNVVRHAQATGVWLVLRQSETHVVLVVRDDGVGFELNTPATAFTEGQQAIGLGILGMRERLRWVGGQLDMNSVPGQGTELRAHVPLKGNRCL